MFYFVNAMLLTKICKCVGLIALVILSDACQSFSIAYKSCNITELASLETGNLDQTTLVAWTLLPSSTMIRL